MLKRCASLPDGPLLSKRLRLQPSDHSWSAPKFQTFNNTLPSKVEIHGLVEVFKDITCDSDYMNVVMPKVAAAIRQKMSPWIPADQIIYLVMDNAGGHGTEDTIWDYTLLLSQYKIEVVQQIPRSPETNLLDLGIWMSIQSAVEREHQFKCHEANALASSVERAWSKRFADGKVFQSVSRRLRKVLDLIIDGNGGNDLVESQRGKLFRDPLDVELVNNQQPAVEALEHVVDDDNFI